MRYVLLVLPCIACASHEAHWAHDTLTIAPTTEGLSASQTWRLYDARWERRQAERRRVCAMLYDLQPVPRQVDCEGCTAAFVASPLRTDGDCLPTVDPTFVALRAVGVAPDATGTTTWFDVGAGWEVHGHTGDAWDGLLPVVVPADHAWELLVPTETSVSRSRVPAPPDML
ncbi:MAG: hypothetical protein KC656_22910 [Myxococcales bacterium]|nr:hypothetical protein [Myxococcales bacterium]